MTETWYILETGEVAHPRDVRPGTDGKLRHKDGRAVAYAAHGPRSRSVDTAAMTKIAEELHMHKDKSFDDVTKSPINPLDHDGDGRAGGSTSGGTDGEMKALREQYFSVFGKRAFPGWVADELRRRIQEESASREMKAATTGGGYHTR